MLKSEYMKERQILMEERDEGRQEGEAGREALKLEIDRLRKGLDRPIGFLLEDVDEYANSRGFVFDPIRDWLPGAQLFDIDDMIGFVSEVAKGGDPGKDRRQELRAKMHSFSDDRSCERLVKYLGLN